MRKKFLQKRAKKEQNFSIELIKHGVFRTSSIFLRRIINYSAEEEKEGEKGGECAFALSIYVQTMSVRRRCYYHHHCVLLLVKLAFVLFYALKMKATREEQLCSFRGRNHHREEEEEEKEKEKTIASV